MEEFKFMILVPLVFIQVKVVKQQQAIHSILHIINSTLK
jgi:hypothetical protein